MGVRTEADEALDAAREHIREAVEELAKIEVEQVPGWDEYTSSFSTLISTAFQTLLEMRRDLK